MRVLQIIDSLEAGGAERMAVNYANALAKEIDFSALVVTRKEGNLRNQINNNVPYLFLNKSSTLDSIALLQLRKFILKNNIEIIHAHGTSFFFAFLLKLVLPSVKLVWHDHLGIREKQSKMQNLSLLLTSVTFSAIFVVNPKMKEWATSNLFTKKVFFIPNFVEVSNVNLESTILKGQVGKRIVCIANLKKPKNHMALLCAFHQLQLYELGWSLHFVGKDFQDDYSTALKEYVNNFDLNTSVFIYDAQDDIQHILSQATIGILASTAEGFPLVLLEYGLAQLAVLSTNVGYCSSLIKPNFSGLLFNPNDIQELQNQLKILISNPDFRNHIAVNLKLEVIENYSREKIIQAVLQKYAAILV